jgi:hypothetical protein
VAGSTYGRDEHAYKMLFKKLWGWGVLHIDEKTILNESYRTRDQGFGLD